MPDYFKLSIGNFAQDWSNTALLNTTDNWSQVASIVGYRGDDIISGTAINPGTLTGDGTVTIDINVNQTNPNTNTSGGVSEFEIANPVVALQGSGTADAPSLVFHLDTTGRESVVFSFNARDIDGSADNAAQQIAVQYHICESGADQFTRGLYLRRDEPRHGHAIDRGERDPAEQRQRPKPGPGARDHVQCRRQ